MNALLDMLRRARSSALSSAVALADQAARGRELSVREYTELEGWLDDVDRYDRRIATLAPQSEDRSTTDLVYSARGAHSFFRDLVNARSDNGARRRLALHRRQIAGEYDRRERELGQHFARRAAQLGLDVETRADMNRTAGMGGDFAPPAWLLDMAGISPRPGRVLANVIPTTPLPRGVQTIKVPLIAGGRATAVADGSGVPHPLSPSSSSVTLPVVTIAGAVSVSQQAVDQTPAAAFDLVVWRELLAAYDATLDLELLTGSGTAPHLQGLLNVPSTVSVTYTSASPTLPELLPKLGSAAAQSSAARGLPPAAMLITPTRWFWAASRVDGSGRLIIESDDTDPDQLAAGRVGALLGLPIYADGNIPANLGAGTNEDRIVLTRPSDHLLFEGEPQLLVAENTAADTLTVTLRLHRYVAFTGALYPSATAIVSGTGLATATF